MTFISSQFVSGSKAADERVERPLQGAEGANASAFRDGLHCGDGSVNTPVGHVARVTTSLSLADRLGTWKVRWGIGRGRYAVEPGLYAVGSPTAESPVLVTANYRLTFDHLRSQLGGRDLWIMVLDTRGINVWCAAGKGTFGTGEIVRRVNAVRLGEIVSHRTLVLPQLGAPGVAAHKVREGTGFRVVYGPVRAADIPAFLDAGMKATPEMRRVRFAFRDRVVLIPMELVTGAKYALPAAAGFFALAGLNRGGYSLHDVLTTGSLSAAVLLLAFLLGVVAPPALLPWLPGRAFAAKGAWVGLPVALGVVGYAWTHAGWLGDRLSAVAWFFVIPAVTSFLAMNFTGASTYTSLSGVRAEMRVAVPAQIACAVLGLVVWIVARFV